MASTPVRVPHAVGFEGLVLIGRGGFASVYRATETAFARDVALKVINVNVTEHAQQRFERECRAIGTVCAHPNIVSVYGAGTTDDGSPYIAMELLTGGSLGERLDRDGPLGYQDVVGIGSAIARAVQAAHDRGVLHRDIKPDNVLVSEYGDPKLADFGISSIAGGFQTRSGLVSGSLAHTAPEVLDGAPATAASDVYALGSTLYTLLVGQPPFVRAEDEGLAALISRTVRDAPPRVTSDRAPAALVDLLDATLSKNPAERPTSAAVLADLLGACCAEPVRSPTVAPGRPADAPALPAHHSAASSTFQVRQTLLRRRHGYAGPPPLADDSPRRSRRALIIAAAIVVLLVGAGALAVAVRSRGTPPLPVPRVSAACDGRSCTFSASDTSKEDDVHWTFSDAGTALGVNVRHDFARSARYGASAVVVRGSRRGQPAEVTLTIAENHRALVLAPIPGASPQIEVTVSANPACAGTPSLRRVAPSPTAVPVSGGRSGPLMPGTYQAAIGETSYSGGFCDAATSRPLVVRASPTPSASPSMSSSSTYRPPAPIVSTSSSCSHFVNRICVLEGSP